MSNRVEWDVMERRPTCHYASLYIKLCVTVWLLFVLKICVGSNQPAYRLSNP